MPAAKPDAKRLTDRFPHGRKLISSQNFHKMSSEPHIYAVACMWPYTYLVK